MTSLADGRSLPKTSPHFAALGDLDEVSAWLSLLAFDLDESERGQVVAYLEALKAVSGRLAGLPAPAQTGQAELASLQAAHDDLYDKVFARGFFRAHRSPAAARADLARAVSRRAERSLLALPEGTLAESDLLFVDLLSDWLFLLVHEIENRAREEARSLDDAGTG